MREIIEQQLQYKVRECKYMQSTNCLFCYFQIHDNCINTVSIYYNIENFPGKVFMKTVTAFSLLTVFSTYCIAASTTTGDKLVLNFFNMPSLAATLLNDKTAVI